MSIESCTRPLGAASTAAIALVLAVAMPAVAGCGAGDGSVARDEGAVTATVGTTMTLEPGAMPTMALRLVTPRPTETPDPARPERAHALVVDGLDPDRLYLTFVRGIMHSADGGLTWAPLQHSKVDEGVELSAAVQLTGGRLVVGGPGTLRMSDDAGTSWQPITPTLTSSAGGLAGLWRRVRGEVDGTTQIDVRGLAVDPTDGHRLYGLFHGLGVAVSADDGATWEPAAGELPPLAFGLWAIGADPTVLATTDRAGGGLLRSADGGATWAALATTGATGEWLAMTRAGPEPGERLVAATTDGLFESGDGGATWAKFGPFKQLVTAAVAPTDPNMIYAITPGAYNVYRSKDGGVTWPGSGTPTAAAAPAATATGATTGGDATPMATTVPGPRP
ncbi:MAG: exo-alpha-sialidase [Ardenticatenales bacterium]|nr:exo-alpha-sialidase [Ardenticatenales bacterium]